ncbi:hypothetical protein ACFSM5_19095 [Lacibacterium aquatile]|uniref:AAA family ATPase n=1 Tax=Lacibacterium aquatile TaxID=1168082 RepID=A0ABW5DYZ1_9PROT
MNQQVEILLITGPAGVGKSTVSWEVGAQLAAKEIAHAIVETDELDRVFPKPSAEELEALRPGTRDISSLTLAGIWSTYHALGHRRLIMSGVMVHVGFDRRWILAAIPDATIKVVRLMGNEATITERLARRETGSGAEAQVQRSLGQAQRIASQDASEFLVLQTDGKSPQELAALILQGSGWV